MTQNEQDLLTHANDADIKLLIARTRYPFEYLTQCPLCRYSNDGDDGVNKVREECAMHRELSRIHKIHSELSVSHHKLIQGVATDNKTYWTIHLDKYERDNLLWLLLLCWYGGIEPFNLASSGDWIAQIPNKLARLDSEGQAMPFDPDPDFKPNLSNEIVLKALDNWVATKVDPDEVKQKLRLESAHVADMRDRLHAAEKEVEALKEQLRESLKTQHTGYGEK